MNTVAAHFLARVRVALTTPEPLGMLILCALVSVFFWPGVLASGGWTELAGGYPGESAVTTVVMLIWVALFPMLLAPAVRPPFVGSARSDGLSYGHPALPIGFRRRMVVEAVAALALLGAFRFGGVLVRDLLIGDGAYPPGVAGSFIAGALLVLPALLVSLTQPPSQELAWAKLGIIAIVITVAMRAGLTSTIVRLAVLSLALSAIVIWSRGLEVGRGARLENLFVRVGRLERPFRTPARQLRIDFLMKPLPVVAGFAVAEVVTVGLFVAGVVNGLTFYYLSTFVFSMLFGVVVLRPMGNPQVIAGVMGKRGYAAGDFGRAFAQLPLPRSLLARTTYLHGFITGSLVWLGVVLVGAINARVSLGEWLFFTGSRGDLTAEIIIPMLAMIPISAGFVVESTVGARRMALLSGALLFLAPQMVLVMLILRVPNAVQAMFVVMVAALGGLPALRHCTERGAEGTPLVTVIP